MYLYNDILPKLVSRFMYIEEIITPLLVAIIPIIITVLFQRRNEHTRIKFERDLSNIQQKNAIEIKSLEDKLSLRKKIRDSRIDYEYEAKKRLYNKFEPLLFLLNEYSESAINRIEDLARESRDMKKIPGKESYFKSDYFLSNTIYKLLLPLVIFKLMQKNLTLYDLKLVPAIEVQYTILKQIYFSFSSDIRISDFEPKIDYEPYPKPTDEQIKANPTKFKKQGIPIGEMDIILESFIKVDTKGTGVISYGELIQNFFKNKKHDEFNNLVKMFERFDPDVQPVTWRILLVQYILYKSIHRSYNLPKNQRKNIKVILPVTAVDKQKLNWFDDENDLSNPILSETMKAVENFVITNPSIVRYCSNVFYSTKEL
jgi:hypothetical protein